MLRLETELADQLTLDFKISAIMSNSERAASRDYKGLLHPLPNKSPQHHNCFQAKPPNSTNQLLLFKIRGHS